MMVIMVVMMMMVTMVMMMLMMLSRCGRLCCFSPVCRPRLTWSIISNLSTPRSGSADQDGNSVFVFYPQSKRRCESI